MESGDSYCLLRDGSKEVAQDEGWRCGSVVLRHAHAGVTKQPLDGGNGYAVVNEQRGEGVASAVKRDVF